MATKSKKRNTALNELHFVSSLHLEQSLGVLQELAQEKRPVTITQVTPDEYTFEIGSALNAKIKGSLKRWQGTETRLDADGNVIRPKLNMWLLLMSVLAVTGSFILAGLVNASFFLEGAIACYWIVIRYAGCLVSRVRVSGALYLADIPVEITAQDKFSPARPVTTIADRYV